MYKYNPFSGTLDITESTPVVIFGTALSPITGEPSLGTLTVNDEVLIYHLDNTVPSFLDNYLQIGNGQYILDGTTVNIIRIKNLQVEIYQEQTSPTAQNVIIEALLLSATKIRSHLQVNYEYIDAQNDVEDTAAVEYVWQIADNNSGLNLVNVATTKEYIPSESTKYLRAGVKVKSLAGKKDSDFVYTPYFLLDSLTASNFTNNTFIDSNGSGQPDSSGSTDANLTKSVELIANGHKTPVFKMTITNIADTFQFHDLDANILTGTSVRISFWHRADRPIRMDWANNSNILSASVLPINTGIAKYYVFEAANNTGSTQDLRFVFSNTSFQLVLGQFVEFSDFKIEVI